MIIDREKLISMLVDKTGLEPEEVEEQLSELVSRIKEAADKGKTFKIEGFGTFQMEGDDLQFEPDNTLETEINNKYAGMKPIELIGAFKEPDDKEIPEIPDPEKEGEGIWTFDDESNEPTAADESEPSQEEEPQPETEEVSAGAPVEPEISAEPDTEEAETDETGISLEEAIANASEAIEESQEESIPEEEDEDESAADEQPKKVAAKASSDKDPIGTVLMAAVVIIVIGIAGWFIYDWGISNSRGTDTAGPTFSNQTTQQQPPSDRQSGKDKADTQDQTDKTQHMPANKNSEPEQNSQVIKQGGAQPKATPDNDSPYGLRGEVNHTISSSYTIVVHSLKDKETAETNRQHLQKEGFRAMMSSANINGTMHYRVGVGQFKTVDAALQAIKKLPEPYKSHNFIKRVTQQ